MNEPCSGYRKEEGMYGKCRHGFMQTPACFKPGGFYYPVPECCDEGKCGKKYAATGGVPVQPI